MGGGIDVRLCGALQPEDNNIASSFCSHLGRNGVKKTRRTTVSFSIHPLTGMIVITDSHSTTLSQVLLDYVLMCECYRHMFTFFQCERN